MEKDRIMDNKRIRFLMSMGKIGCIGFGGGSILIPVIEEEIIHKHKIDTKQQYDKDVIVASITPGALPVEIAASLGRRNFGYAGMILGAVLMAFPGALATVLLLMALSVVRARMLLLVEYMTIGIASFIILLLTKYICSVEKASQLKGKSQMLKTMSVMALVFLLVGGDNVYQLFGIEKTPVFSISALQILALVFFFAFYTRGSYTWKHIIISVVLGSIYLLGSGKAQLLVNPHILALDKLCMFVLAVYGFVSSVLKNREAVRIDKKSLVKDLGVWVAVIVVIMLLGTLFYSEIIAYVVRGCLSVVMSFGGGDAYLTIADGIFVESGMITQEQFYGQIVSVVNILPGSILCKTLSGIGYYIGLNAGGTIAAGLLFAVVGFAVSIAVSCATSGLIYNLYDGFIQLRIFQTISNWIRPIIAGLLIDIMLSLCNQCMGMSGDLGISRGFIFYGLLFGYILDCVMMLRFQFNTLIVLLVNIVLTLGVFFLIIL